jgi:hypothetical protein
MYPAALLLLIITGLSWGSNPGRMASVAGDSLPGTVVAAAGRLLDMAGLLFSDEAPTPDSMEALMNSLDSLGLAGAPAAGDPDRHKAFDAARRSLREVTSAGMSRDTVRSSFRELFFTFHNLYLEEFQRTLRGDSGVTLILFSASITCDCTRKLSDSYIRQIVQAKNMLEGFPTLLVMDCAVNPKLMDQYGIETLPTILMLDGNNRELARFRETEFILPGLVEHLQAVGRGSVK